VELQIPGEEHPEQDTRQTDLDPLDRIDRSIDIDASAERVWELVSRPGWWINEGAVDPEPDLTVDGADAVLRHPAYGEFRLQVLESRPHSYVSFRWMDPAVEAGTLVEFWIEPRDRGVTLRVAESGFSALGKSREDWLKHREGNVEGWKSELGAARTWLERSGDAA
jgi:uncharacterized protein YndB with AHSA1/START domain